MALPTDDVLKSWNQIMRYQVDFSFPLELPVYLSMESWRSADYVLDLGSGDGYYARRLAEYFIEKSYTCVDIDDRAIEAGRMQFVASGDPLDSAEEFQIEFENADILNYKGSFPVAIARLLVQHLDAPVDYESLRTELDDWSRNEHSYSQIGVNACAYSRVG